MLHTFAISESNLSSISLFKKQFLISNICNAQHRSMKPLNSKQLFTKSQIKINTFTRHSILQRNSSIRDSFESIEFMKFSFLLICFFKLKSIIFARKREFVETLIFHKRLQIMQLLLFLSNNKFSCSFKKTRFIFILFLKMSISLN